MKETEITVQVFNSIDEIKQMLMLKEFEILEEYNLNDFYFSKFSKQELNNFEYKDLLKNSFIVREVLDDNPKTLLIYKNKIVDENNIVISEEKIKIKVEDLNNILNIFEKIGLNCWCTLNQNMIVYKKDNIKFTLQNVQGLGTFIECEEDNTMAMLNEYEKINLMLNNLKSLGFEMGSDYSCKKVYMKFKNGEN
ncbi:MAG: hypothetical protein E7376_04950 [Clostridiales bacterium]|nr:hypothetical protein [Clostridiales bacterium]